MHNGQAEGRGRRTAFLAALQEGRSVTGAAMAAGVNRTSLYKWRNEMADFAAAWDEAVRTSADLIEDEALRRAMQGVQRPVFYRGEQIGTVTTYSDRLLVLLLQRRRPAPPPARPGAEAQAGASDLAERLKAAKERMARFRREEEAAKAGRPPAAASTAAPAAPATDMAVPVAAISDNGVDTTRAVAPSRHNAAAAAPAAPPPGDANVRPPSRRRADPPDVLRSPLLSREALMAGLSSAQALAALADGRLDDRFARFGSPWGR